MAVFLSEWVYVEGLSLSLFARAIECRSPRLDDPFDPPGLGDVACASGARLALPVIDGEAVLEIAEFAIVMDEVPQG
jgi:hypothetical protein